MDIKKHIKFIIPIIIILIILMIIILIPKKDNMLKCTKDSNIVSGIQIDEMIKIKLADKAIKQIKNTKKIKLSKDYLQYDTYKNIFEMHLKSAYQYLDEKDYKISTSKDTLSVDANITKKGLILNSLTVELSDNDNKYDLKINTENNFENAQNYIKIGDKYSKANLKKYMEESGYKCE